MNTFLKSPTASGTNHQGPSRAEIKICILTLIQNQRPQGISRGRKSKKAERGAKAMSV